LLSLIEHGLEQTASLWPDIERAYKWIHQAAHILNNHDDENAATVQRRFNGMVGAMVRHRDRAGSLSEAIAHFGKVTRICHARTTTSSTSSARSATTNAVPPDARRPRPRPCCVVRRAWSPPLPQGGARQAVPIWGALIGNNGKISGSISTGGARRAPCAPASGAIPLFIWRNWRKRLAS
jgi:hypothetical protein